jgi:hypothetical protein
MEKLKMSKKQMTATIENNEVVIRLPFDLLAFAQKNRPEEPYHVTDKKAMGEYIANNILDYTKNVGEQEMGNSVFTVLLDKLFSEAYEDGETWLDSVDWEDAGWDE